MDIYFWGGYCQYCLFCSSLNNWELFQIGFCLFLIYSIFFFFFEYFCIFWHCKIIYVHLSLSLFFFFLALNVGPPVPPKKAQNLRQIKLRRCTGAESFSESYCEAMHSSLELLGRDLNHRTPHQRTQESNNSSWFQWLSPSAFVSHREMIWPEWIRSWLQMSSVEEGPPSPRCIRNWMEGSHWTTEDQFFLCLLFRLQSKGRKNSCQDKTGLRYLTGLARASSSTAMVSTWEPYVQRQQLTLFPQGPFHMPVHLLSTMSKDTGHALCWELGHLMLGRTHHCLVLGNLKEGRSRLAGVATLLPL